VNRYVADPHWGGLIVAYFFLGGIAGGSYVMAALADLLGDDEDRRAVRPAYYLAFPLVCACGILLIVDLNRPERFWHMLWQSETGRPMLKWWSPMSIGSWGVSAFGAFSFASFVGVLAEDGRLGLRRFAPLAARLRTGLVGTTFALGGAISAFFLSSYTGVLLTATNQPIWSDTTWIGALFLASAASTGVATLVLLARRGPRGASPPAIARLEWLDGWAIALELLLLAGMALSLGGLAATAFGRWPGILVPAFVVPAGLVLPLGLKLSHRPAAGWAAAALVLLGGLALRVALVGTPPPLLVASGG
jgi:formate-dependent nitrite reductase membrane component NrfD